MIKLILKNLVAFLLILSLICITCFLCVGKGYTYYDILKQPQVYLGVGKSEKLLEVTVENYLKQIEQDGYTIADYSVNIVTLVKPIITDKRKINDEIVKENILKEVDVSVFLYKLILDKDISFTFKSEKDCEYFAKKIKQTNYKIENYIGNIDEITDAATLQKLEKRQYGNTSSRGSFSRQEIKIPLGYYYSITSPYGMRHGIMHTGVDFAADTGEDVYAWKSGIVVAAHWNGNYGKFIEIKHSDGTVSRYAHLSSYSVAEGDTVLQWQKIGEVGSTGNSTGPHLHLEIKVNDEFVNPMKYL